MDPLNTTMVDRNSRRALDRDSPVSIVAFKVKNYSGLKLAVGGSRSLASELFTPSQSRY